jgi:hypothetical protein
LDTRLDTPPSINRRHPDSGLALTPICVASSISAVVLDWFSPRVLSWRLSITMEAACRSVARCCRAYSAPGGNSPPGSQPGSFHLGLALCRLRASPMWTMLGFAVVVFIAFALFVVLYEMSKRHE